jgi:DNA-binding CsgD family transcriptional regulator
MAPLGLGDELRIALVSAGRCWGVLCLHREDGELGFAQDEISLFRDLGPRLAEGLRRGVALFPTSSDESAAEGPGIIILDAQLSLVSVNSQARYWLAELAETNNWDRHSELPLSIFAAAASALGVDAQARSEPPSTRLPRARGGWITVHASTLRGAEGHQIAVILDAADASQLSSLVLAAHGLTPAQSRVAALVLQGRSTRSIVAELHISPNTMQEHLRAVFDKFGIGSRRELVTVLSGRHH